MPGSAAGYGARSASRWSQAFQQFGVADQVGDVATGNHPAAAFGHRTMHPDAAAVRRQGIANDGAGLFNGKFGAWPNAGWRAWSMARDRLAARVKQSFVLRLDRRVTFAGGPAEAIGIVEFHAAPAVVDEVGLLQRGGHPHYAVAACADHLGHRFLG